MPEQLTKHPEVTLTVLRSAGGQCGEGARQEILSSCPPARFCKFPGGEICVYGLDTATQMTQISRMDWRALQVLQKENVPALHTVPIGTLLIACVVSLALGVGAHPRLGEERRRRALRRDQGLTAPDGPPAEDDR